MPEQTKQIKGRIILIQENRFRMVDDAGRGYLFNLSHATYTSLADLKRWHAEGIPVKVDYHGEANLASGIADRVTPLSTA